MSLRFQETFNFNGRHAARAGGSYCLTVSPVLHVPRVEDAGYVSARSALGEDITILVGQDLAAEYRRVRDVSDSHEESVDVLVPLVIADYITQLYARHVALLDVIDILYDGVGEKLDFGICPG